MRARSVAAAMVIASLAVPFAAQAQVLGTFRWQLIPHCNVVTLTVTQTGGIYTLDGTDDQCGSGASTAGVTGVAYPTTGGNVGMSLATVLPPSAAPVHTDVTLTVPALNGTWRDSVGNSGTFVFTSGGAVPGAVRQVPAGGLPPGSVTAVQLAFAAVTDSSIAGGAITASKIASNAINSSALIATGTIELSDLNQQLVASSSSVWTIAAGACVAKETTTFASSVQEGDLLLTRIQSGPTGVFALSAVAGANGRVGYVICNPGSSFTSQFIGVAFRRVPR